MVDHAERLSAVPTRAWLLQRMSKMKAHDCLREASRPHFSQLHLSTGARYGAVTGRAERVVMRTTKAERCCCAGSSTLAGTEDTFRLFCAVLAGHGQW